MTDVLEHAHRQRPITPAVVLVGVDEAGNADMPSFSEVAHISFSATDPEASAGFWRQVFGFSELDRADDDGGRTILLIHPQTSAIIELQQHDADEADGVEPGRTGFDHLGLKVDGRSELDSWQAHFERLDVPHTPTVDRRYGSVLTFCDPDGIQLELFSHDGTG